jgi:hypothetical protein
MIYYRCSGLKINNNAELKKYFYDFKNQTNSRDVLKQSLHYEFHTLSVNDVLMMLLGNFKRVGAS